MAQACHLHHVSLMVLPHSRVGNVDIDTLKSENVETIVTNVPTHVCLWYTFVTFGLQYV